MNLCVLLLCSADRCGRDWMVSIPWPYVAVCDVGSTFFQERVSNSMYFLSTSCVSVRHIQVCCRFAGSRSYSPRLALMTKGAPTRRPRRALGVGDALFPPRFSSYAASLSDAVALVGRACICGSVSMKRDMTRVTSLVEPYARWKAQKNTKSTWCLRRGMKTVPVRCET